MTENWLASMKNAAAISLLILSIGVLFAEHQARFLNRKGTSKELMQLERDIGRAEINRDYRFLEKVEADELVFTLENGALCTKRQDIDGWKTAPADFKILTYDADDMNVSLYGKFAVVRGRIMETGEAKYKAYTRRYRFTDTFVWRGGRWQLAAAHLSTLPKSQVANERPNSESEHAVLVTEGMTI